MATFAENLIASLKQAAAHAEGKPVPGMRVTTAATPRPQRSPPKRQRRRINRPSRA